MVNAVIKKIEGSIELLDLHSNAEAKSNRGMIGRGRSNEHGDLAARKL